MSRYRGPVVDIDIHHSWKRADEVIAYLPQEWRDYATAEQRFSGRERANVRELTDFSLPGDPPRVSAIYNYAAAGRRDAVPPDGTLMGSSYELLRDQVLDRYNVYRAILTFNVGTNVHSPNRNYAVALSRAANDWNRDAWLSLDERLYSVVLPASSVPEEAAKEIRRVGAHPRIVALILAGAPMNRPYGDPLYHPMYEACAELGLAVHLHVGVVNEEQPPGGLPMSTIGLVTCESQQAMHHITSFIVNGVFEKYPGLKLVVKEFGTAWLPYLTWRLDRNYDLLRLESPWVKRRPSEYIHDHVRLDTQPFEEGPRRDDLERVLGTIDGVEDVICFASDYPHAAFDDAEYVSARLPERWRRKIMLENACACYGWTPPAAVAA